MAYESPYVQNVFPKHIGTPVSSYHEQMMTGSPSSPPALPPAPTSSAAAAAGMASSPYLPGYLLGDMPTASPSTPVAGGRQGWPHAAVPGGMPGHSRLHGHHSSLLTGGGGGSGSLPTLQQLLLQASPGAAEGRSRDSVGGSRGKDKPAPPPVVGLLEIMASGGGGPLSTPVGAHSLSSAAHAELSYVEKMSLQPTNILSRTPSGPGHAASNFSYSSPAVGGHGPQTPAGNLTRMQQQQAAYQLLSPAQVDPFYTQGEALTPADVLDERWVTVFGFQPAAASFILRQFSQYGTIVDHVISSDGNWMHLRYQTKIQAKKALSKNGKVIGNNTMVGVRPCIDKEAMGRSDENADLSLSASNLSRLDGSRTPGVTGGTSSIRPLTAAYKSATAASEVVSRVQIPKKSSGFISKAMEYMFGW